MRTPLLFLFLAIIVLGLVSGFITGCAQSPSSNYNFYAKTTSVKSSLIKKIIVLPSDINFSEKYTGGYYEYMPMWSRRINSHVSQELSRYLTQQLLIPAVVLNQKQKTGTVEKHIELIKTVMIMVEKYSDKSKRGWPDLSRNFSYSIGDGLQQWKEQGIDAALIISGRQSISIPDHARAYVSHSKSPNVDFKFNKLKASITLIDIKTGALLWFNNIDVPAVDLRDEQNINQFFSYALRPFPKKLISHQKISKIP